MKVFKYQFEISDYFFLDIPENAKILDVQMQNGRPCIWALIDEMQPTVRRKFRFAGTGHDIYEFKECLEYVGTFQMNSGQLVFHIFEIK